MVGVLDLRLEAPFDNGLGGRLVILVSPLGGWGKELMLTTFRIVFAPVAPPILETDRGCGRAVVGAGVEGGRKVAEGARSPLLGVFGVDLGAGGASPPVLFRVLPTGSAGSATVGGPLDGRAGLGNAVDILESNANPSRNKGLAKPESNPNLVAPAKLKYRGLC